MLSVLIYIYIACCHTLSMFDPDGQFVQLFNKSKFLLVTIGNESRTTELRPVDTT